MTTEALSSQSDRLAARREPRRGIVDRVLLLVDRLPGPAAAWWLVIGLMIAVLGHLLVWASTERPFGVIHHDVVAPALMFAWFAWLTHTLNKVATAAFEEFRPALDDPDSEDDYRFRLTTIDDRLALVAGIVAIVIVSFAYFVGVRPLREPAPADIEQISAPIWGLTAFSLGIVVLHTATQLRLVSRLSAVARNVDIFHPRPINAFSRLTAVSAIGLIGFVFVFMLYTRDQPVAYIIQEAILLAIAAASFVLPLRIMHNRLVVEKARLQAANQDRLKSVLARIHGAVDSGDLRESEQLNNAVTAVLAERDVLDRLHTWPWSASTFRGFASALLLPIGLIVLTQVIERFL